jgi:hypothetical protein
MFAIEWTERRVDDGTSQDVLLTPPLWFCSARPPGPLSFVFANIARACTSKGCDTPQAVPNTAAVTGTAGAADEALSLLLLLLLALLLLLRLNSRCSAATAACTRAGLLPHITTLSPLRMNSRAMQ